MLFFFFLGHGISLGADSRDALQKAADLVQQGRLEEADQQARLALSDPQTRAVAYSVLGTIRFQQKRLDESASLLRQAIRLNPQLLGAHLSLAQVYTIQGKPERALPIFRQVLTLDPLDVGARLALARAEAEKGRYRQSLEFATPVLPALKQSPDGLLVLAADLAKLGKHAALADLATDWMQLNGVPADWSIKFALLLANNGAVPQAIEVLERTKQTSTPSYQLAFNLGGAYSMKHEFPRALDSYDEALTFDPRSMPALRQAAFIAE
ncbi:MAG TPA: tetratricopeptide repeat protein, partial [Terriglobales bacterium]|nr:tetratricopeptide repeat protein [Terriglobales bacterium]